ncbi:MAG: hypothetical protein ABIP18_17005 [Steroidobacteraceae bacterium]
MRKPMYYLTLALLMVTCFDYLRRSRNISVKRWMLPLTTAAVAALLALVLLRFTANRLVDYAVMVPLALSAGMVLQHLLDYCRRCGTARPLPRLSRADSARSKGCPGCRNAMGWSPQR